MRNEISAAIEDLQTKYAEALDSQNMEAWSACFSSEPAASYICISAENDRRGLPLALMYDDSRARIEDRVSIVTKVWVGTYEPYYTRHFVQRQSCRTADEDQYEVTTSFMLTMTPEGGLSSLLTTGLYRDTVEISSRGALLARRRAIYDASVLPRYVVFPF